MLFTLTTSHRWPGRSRGKLLSMFIENLKKNYGLREYVWVKEEGKSKPPHYRKNIHYHFVADIDYINPTALSLYWSGLFGFDCKVRNALRIGSKPDKNGRRMYYLNSPAHAWYLSKYLGKGFGKRKSRPAPFYIAGHTPQSREGRRFGISNRANILSRPECFESKLSFNEVPGTFVNAKGELVAHPIVCVGHSQVNEQGLEFDKSKYTWKKCKDHNVWIGNINR